MDKEDSEPPLEVGGAKVVVFAERSQSRMAGEQAKGSHFFLKAAYFWTVSKRGLNPPPTAGYVG